MELIEFEFDLNLNLLYEQPDESYNTGPELLSMLHILILL